jgi:hypothetical protein
MTVVEQPQMGAAGFLAALTAHGYTVTEQAGFAIFRCIVEVGRRAGEQVKVGLLIPGTGRYPRRPARTSARLGHPAGAVQPSPLGADWEKLVADTRTAAQVVDGAITGDGEAEGGMGFAINHLMNIFGRWGSVRLNAGWRPARSDRHRTGTGTAGLRRLCQVHPAGIRVRAFLKHSSRFRMDTA